MNPVHGSCAFTIDALNITVEVLEARIDDALNYLLAPDDGYGLSPDGVAELLRILRGEVDE